MRCGNESVPAITAGHGKSSDSLSNTELLHVPARRIDVSDNVIAWRERKRRHAWVKAPAHQDIGEGNTCRQHLHAYLRWPRLWQFFLNPLQYFRATQAGDDHARIFLGRHGGNSLS